MESKESKEAEPPMNCYLSSLEEQVRCELLDCEARLTQTKSEGRVLLEIDEDCLQHFLDVLHEKIELSKNVGQATVAKQLDVSIKLKVALDNAKQELKNGHLQWQEEMSSLKAHQQKYCDEFQSQLDVIASIRAQEQEVEKETLEKAQAFSNAQMDEQRAQTKQAKQTLERFQAAHEGQLEEQRAETNKILAVLEKTEDQLEAELLRSQEQSSLTAQLEKSYRSDLDHAQLKNIAALQILEEEATQMVNRNQASQAQLEEQRVEINRIKAAWKRTEDLLQTERLLWQQEKYSLLQTTEDLQATEKALQSQITNKQKKKKWFKLLMPGSLLSKHQTVKH